MLFYFFVQTAQHRLSSTSLTLGGQDSHPWWPSLFFINKPAQQEQEGRAAYKTTQICKTTRITKPAAKFFLNRIINTLIFHNPFRKLSNTKIKQP